MAVLNSTVALLVALAAWLARGNFVPIRPRKLSDKRSQPAGLAVQSIATPCRPIASLIRSGTSAAGTWTVTHDYSRRAFCCDGSRVARRTRR